VWPSLSHSKPGREARAHHVALQSALFLKKGGLAHMLRWCKPPVHTPPDKAMAAAAQPWMFRLRSVCRWCSASKAISRQPTAGAHAGAHAGTIIRVLSKQECTCGGRPARPSHGSPLQVHMQAHMQGQSSGS